MTSIFRQPKRATQPRATQGRIWHPRTGGVLLVLVLVTGSHAFGADSVPSSQSNPNASAASNTQPPSQDSDESAEPNPALPPGHPPVDSMPDTEAAADDGQDPGGSSIQLSRDTITRSAAIPAGTIEVRVVNVDNQPVARATVVLQLHRESVAQGNTEGQRDVVTSAAGVARFEHLATDSTLSYRVMINDGGVKYGVQPFQLTEQAGVGLTLHQYPIVRDLKQALVAVESLVFVEPRDDVFQFEVVYELFNVGHTLWVPDQLHMRLPSERKAFNTQLASDDVRVEASDVGVRLAGAVPPGQHQVSYTFQVPRHNAPNASFDFEMPPNVMQVKVGLASSRGAELLVDGFPDPQPTTAQNGQRLLLTSKSFQRSSPLSSELRLEVRGLPTVGFGRIVAAFAATTLAIVGLAFALSKRARGAPDHENEALQDRARERLLNELVELEGAKLTGRIGPRTYEETRGTLMDALIRLEPAVD